MPSSRSVVLACCLVPGIAAPGHGAGEEARKVVERGIKALGGEANLTKHRAVTCKAEGTIHLKGRAIACTVRVVYQPPFQHHLAAEGSDLKAATVLNGDRGWLKMNETVTAMTREQVREVSEGLHAEWVAGLVPLLRGKGYGLALLGETRIDGGKVVILRVRHRGYRDVKLYLSKETGLPAKLEVMLKVEGKLVKQEVLFRDYEKFGEVRRPRKVTTRRDGKEFAAWEVTEYQALEKKVGDGEFGRP